MQTGVPEEKNSLITRQRNEDGTLRDERYVEEHADGETTDAALTGAAAGGALGGLAGILVGIGALAIPGVGPIIAAGPLAAGLTGAAIGAAGGGLIGALAGLGLDEDEARIYKDEVDRGGVLVTVEDDGMHHDAISEIYQRHNSTHYKNW